MSEPTRAVVVNGTVLTAILMDDETEQLFRDNNFIELMWPGGDLVNVTDLVPTPSEGWTYDGTTFMPPPPPESDPVPDPTLVPDPLATT